MRGSGDTLIALGLVFAPLSLLSFGGGNAVIADIAQQAIQVQGWTSEREFAARASKRFTPASTRSSICF